DLRRARAERDAARVRRRHARATHDALRLLPAAAAPQRRRSRRPPAQALPRARAPQAAARFSRARRRRHPRSARFSARIHVGIGLANHAAGAEENSAARVMSYECRVMSPLQRLLSYFARYKWSLLAGGSCVVGSAVFSLLKPAIVGNAVDVLTHAA